MSEKVWTEKANTGTSGELWCLNRHQVVSGDFMMRVEVVGLRLGPYCYKVCLTDAGGILEDLVSARAETSGVFEVPEVIAHVKLEYRRVTGQDLRDPIASE